MEFKQLSVKNFLVFGDKLQTLKLDKRGLVLIDGNNEDASGFHSNGSGKSSLLSAIPYALYGVLPDGKSGDDIINNKTKKNMQVSLTFSLNKVDYEVTRYRKDSKYKNKVFLYENGKDITQASIRKTNEYLETLLGISEDTFLNSILFGLGGKIKFTNASDKDKKRLLEDIANISIYKQAQVIAKEDLRNSQEKLNTLKLTQASIKQNLQFFQTREESNQQALQAYQERLNSIEERYNTAKVNYEATVAGYQKQEWEQKLPTYKQSVAKIKQALLEDAESRKQNQEVLVKLTNLQNQIANQQRELQTHQQAVQASAQQFTTFQTQKMPICPTCGAVMNKEHYQKEILNLVSTYRQEETQVTTIQEQLQALQKQLQTLQPQAVKAQQSLDNVQNAIKKQSYYSQQITLEAAAKQKVLAAKQAVELAKSEYENPPKKPDLYQVTDKEIAATKDKLEQNEVQVAELEDQINKLTDTTKIYSDSGVVSHVLDLVMPYLNQQANYYLSQLTDNSISVKINPQTEAKNGNKSEKLNIEIQNLNGGNDYILNSTGEKKRIDLAISLALQDYVMSKSATRTNLIGYDEIFDGLDEVGIQRVMLLLKERVKNVSSVFVISHNQELKELFENVVTVDKEGGLSTIG